MASELSNNKIYQVLTHELKDTDVEILAPGLDGYEASIVRWSEAAEKKAVSILSLVIALKLTFIQGCSCISRDSRGCFQDREGCKGK
jgi:hypothetical protein